MPRAEKKTLPPPLEFLRQYDLEHGAKAKFEDKYVRQTFLIEKSILEQINGFLKKRPGFKTKFVNYALAFCINEMIEREEQTIQKASEARELTMNEVLDKFKTWCTNNTVEETLQQEIQSQVLKDLFSKNPEKTTLYDDKKQKYISPCEKTRGYLGFLSAEACVLSMFQFYLTKLRKAKQNQ